MKIYALGPQGSNGEHVASHIVSPTQVELCNSNNAVFDSVARNEEAVLGVIPIENSLEGPVGEVIKGCWMSHPRWESVKIVGEQVLRVEHCFLVKKHTKGSRKIRRILSHPQALAQCSQFLDTMPEAVREPTLSTAGAAQLVSEDTSGEVAAIASPRASHIYGLEIRDRGRAVSNYPVNLTRFHTVMRKNVAFDEKEFKGKSCYIFWVEDEPGVVVKALSSFSKRGINVSSLHSIPLGDTLGHYAMYCEVDCWSTRGVGADAEYDLMKVALRVRKLGAFPQNDHILVSK